MDDGAGVSLAHGTSGDNASAAAGAEVASEVEGGRCRPRTGRRFEAQLADLHGGGGGGCGADSLSGDSSSLNSIFSFGWKMPRPKMGVRAGDAGPGAAREAAASVADGASSMWSGLRPGGPWPVGSASSFRRGFHSRAAPAARAPHH